MSRAMLAKWAFYGKRLHYAFGHLNRILCDFAVSGSPGSLEAADASVEDMSAFIPLEILRDDPQVSDSPLTPHRTCFAWLSPSTCRCFSMHMPVL